MFTKLLNLVKPIIEKKYTTLRKTIPPKERLAMTSIIGKRRFT